MPEARGVGRFPSICPNGKCIQSVSSPGCLTPNCSVGSGKCLVVAFLKCLDCSDVLAPLNFRAGAVLLSHRSPLRQDLAPFGFPAREYGSEGVTEHFSASLAGGNHKEGTNACVSNLLLPGVSDLCLLPSLSVGS